MDKKIILTLVSLLAVALIIVAVVLVTGDGGVIGKTKGYSDLFDDMTFDGQATYRQYLECPESWEVNDTKTVKDVIVDMRIDSEQIAPGKYLYTTDLWFVYVGEKWNDPSRGTNFYVPVNTSNGWMEIKNGMFRVTVTTITDLDDRYDVGDSITLESRLVTNVNGDLAYDTWEVKNVD